MLSPSMTNFEGFSKGGNDTVASVAKDAGEKVVLSEFKKMSKYIHGG